MPPTDRKEPGRKWAVFLAVLVHLIFIGVLVFGVSWQTREAGPVMAELWPSLPAPAQKAAPKPEPAPVPKPEPKPEPRPEPKPEPKVEQPKPPKVDIELKEKEKKRKEEQKKFEEQKKEKAEAQKKADAEKRKLDELKRQEQEKQKQDRLEQERRQQQMEAAQAVARRQASARQSEIDGYRRRISDKVKRTINNQTCQPLNNPTVEFDVTLMPTGQLLMDPKLRKSSGNAMCDQAIEKAILLAQPLPLPPADSGLFGSFRELHLELHPND